MTTCSNGHETREVSRRTVREAVEEVVYKREKIKHFDREGSEFWTEINVPDLIEREVEIDIVEFVCPTCGQTSVVRSPKAEVASS